MILKRKTPPAINVGLLEVTNSFPFISFQNKCKYCEWETKNQLNGKSANTKVRLKSWKNLATMPKAPLFLTFTSFFQNLAASSSAVSSTHHGPRTHENNQNPMATAPCPLPAPLPGQKLKRFQHILRRNKRIKLSTQF